MLQTIHILCGAPLISCSRGVTLKSARDSPEQPGTARVLEITPVLLEYCLNKIVVEIIYGYIIVLNKVCRIS
jgi:hypothetical protein